MIGNKHVFWQAFLLALLIFSLGFILGISLENSRNEKVEIASINSEINVLDSQIIGEIGTSFNLSCESRAEQLSSFADRIFNEAKQLEKYDSSSQLTETLTVLHTRYDLLRVILWKEAIDLNEECGQQFHTVVYIYQYDEADIETRSLQTAFALKLEEVKEEKGDEILLIPLAGDAPLASLDLIRERYDIDEYPVIIIDESKIIRNLDQLKELSSYID